MRRITYQTYDGSYKHFNNLEWTGAMGDAVFIMNYVHYRPGPFWIKDHNDNYARHYPGLADYYPESMAKMQNDPVPGDLAGELTCCRFANWLWEEKKAIVPIKPKNPVTKKASQYKVVIAQRESKGQTEEDLKKYIPNNATEIVNVAHQRWNGIDWLIQELASADYYVGSCTGPSWLAASLGIESKMVAYESSDAKFINNVREWFDMQKGCEWIRIGVRDGKGGTKADKDLDRKVRSAPPKSKAESYEYYRNAIR